MRKLILPIIICIFITLFSGCTAKKTENFNEVKINMPKDNSVNGYRTESSKNSYPNTIEGSSVIAGNVSQDTNSYTYCGNKNSKVFHKKSCSSVKTIKEENYIYFSSREEFINKKYTPCKKCNP